jgi:hypothetical protein
MRLAVGADTGYTTAFTCLSFLRARTGADRAAAQVENIQGIAAVSRLVRGEWVGPELLGVELTI